MLTVTHELRTPLTAINGYGELLAQTENENKRNDTGHDQRDVWQLQYTL